MGAVTTFDDLATGQVRAVVGRVPAGPGAPRQCRRYAQAVFAAVPDLADVAALAASELATEAVLGGAPSLLVRVDRLGGGGRVAVNARPDGACPTRGGQPRLGRILVGALADQLGVDCRSGEGWISFAPRPEGPTPG